MIWFDRLRRQLFQALGMKPEGQVYQPVILVTGCASGIGFAIASLLYHQKRYRVVVTARKSSLPLLREKFQETDRFWICELDVTDESQRLEIVRKITERWGSINILINNAGISYRAVIEDMTDSDELKQISVNYLAPMALTRLVLPMMRERGRGKLIYVSSVSGMMAMPTMGSYSASKYALEGACEALWYEARPYGIDVVLVQPGFIHSRSFENVYYSEKSKAALTEDSPYSDYYAHMSPFIEKMMKISPTTPEMLADLILKVIRKENPHLWWPGTWDAVLFYYVRRLVPRRLFLPFLFFCLPGASRWGRKHTHRRR